MERLKFVLSQHDQLSLRNLCIFCRFTCVLDMFQFRDFQTSRESNVKFLYKSERSYSGTVCRRTGCVPGSAALSGSALGESIN